MKTHKVRLVVNGREYTVDVPANERLVNTLRYRLGFTSVKEGCGRGECGTCIVLVNGEPRNSCLLLTATLDGAEVVTLEGIAPSGMLHAVQVALLETGGIQCGFCVPGVLMVMKALIDRTPDPSVDEIKEWLSSVLCRCGSYHYYVKAAQLASKYVREGRVFFNEKEVREKLYMKPLEVRE